MILTAIILLVYTIIAIWGCQYTTDDNHFFGKNYTTVIKGLCCIIVIFVHIPMEHGNILQDAIGSFAYICVTLFFMFSGYGLTWSVIHKQGYLNNFLQNRILALIIPCVIVNLIIYMFGFPAETHFMLVFLMFYIVFYASHKFIKAGYQNVSICLFVIAYSLLGKLTDIGIGWYPESLGFMYGIIFANVINEFKNKSKSHYFAKICVLVFVSVMLGIMYLKFKYLWFVGDYLLKIILGIILTTFLFALTTHIKVGNVANRYLGKISYEVFLAHGFVINLINHINLEISSGVYILFTITGTMIFASLLNVLDVYIIKKVTVPNQEKKLNTNQPNKNNVSI